MNKNKKGFTLIEMLVVVVIIAIIAGITTTVVYTSVSNAKKKYNESFQETVLQAVYQKVNDFQNKRNFSGDFAEARIKSVYKMFNEEKQFKNIEDQNGGIVQYIVVDDITPRTNIPTVLDEEFLDGKKDASWLNAKDQIVTYRKNITIFVYLNTKNSLIQVTTFKNLKREIAPSAISSFRFVFKG